MTDDDLRRLLEELTTKPQESQWIEFKHNFHSAEEIGERISALSNGACLEQQPYGYIVFGVENSSHKVIGTDFYFAKHKKGNDEIENWLIQRLSPRIDFRSYEFDYDGKLIVLLKIPAARNQPVSFLHIEYVRIGSITRKLRDFPEKERKIWRRSDEMAFEKGIACSGVKEGDVVELLDTSAYFSLMQRPYPSHRNLVVEKFISEKFVVREERGYGITNIGALLFARNLSSFSDLEGRAPRVVVCQGSNKLNTIRDITGQKGYAAGFESIIAYINNQLPQNEVLGQALRRTVQMYPKEAVRELVANALVHQDFHEKGRPVVEIYSDRIEITNSGVPIIPPIRFIDDHQARNEMLSDMMRKLHICEILGSGIDRSISFVEIYQLPAPKFLVQEKHTKVILYAHQQLKYMEREDKVRACYQHCCLKYVSNKKMTNQTLRARFQIEEKNAAIASRIIKDTLEQNFIKFNDPDNTSKKYANYIPFWA